jgi:Spy/CpxP family protein refolding chaperone
MRLDNSKRNLSLLGLVLSLAVTLPTFAQEPGANSTQAARPVEGQQQPANQDPLASLQLTGEQRAAIRAIRITSRDEQAAITQKLRRANRAIEEALDTEEPNEALIEQHVKEFGEAHAALRRLIVKRELSIRRVLTPEQRAVLRDLVHKAQINAQEQRQNQNNERGNRPRQSNSIAPGPDLRRNGLPRRPR